MCYSIYLSTTSPRNLGEEKFDHLFFAADLDPEPGHESLLALLAHPQRWYLNRVEYGGCSCHFRHSIDRLVFEPPQEWSPEDEDLVAATREAYREFRRIVAEGHELDVLCVWSGELAPDRVGKLEVRLDEIGEESFRFFEDYRFEFRP